MGRLDLIYKVLIFLGIVLLIIGFIQGLPFAAQSGSYEHAYMVRTIRKYVFISLGAVILLISYITYKVEDAIISVYMKIPNDKPLFSNENLSN